MEASMYHRKELSVTGRLLWGAGFLLCSVAAAVGQSHNLVTPGSNRSLQMNVTEEPASCVVNEKCDVAGAVIGALLSGIVIGAALMFAVHCYLQKRKVTAPPKDYDVSETRRLDVNRNNDDVQFPSHVQASQDAPGVKGHKKLERLVKPSPIPPGHIEIPSAATPLMKQNVQPPAEAADDPEISVITPGKAARAEPREDSVYANVGDCSLISQPYESLGIIQEEAEYEQPRSSKTEDFAGQPSTK